MWPGRVPKRAREGGVLGRGAPRTIFPKIVFLGVPEHSLGEKASEVFANIQKGENDTSRDFPFWAFLNHGKRSGKL